MSIGTVLFNPFNGLPRHPSDIASDPKGLLLWDGEEPLRAAQAAQPAPEPVGHLYTIAGIQHCTITQVLGDCALYAGPVEAIDTSPERVHKSGESVQVPISAIRAIAVEAIRSVTGFPDIKGNGGKYLSDEMEDVARHAASQLSPPDAEALRKELDRVKGERDAMKKDAGRLDYLQTTGSTIDLWPGRPWEFRVSGLLASRSASVREAIDAAIAAQGAIHG